MSGNSSVRINNIQVKTYADPTDQVVAWSNVSGNTVLLQVGTLYTGGNTTLEVNTFIVTKNDTPINSVQNTNPGQIWTDGNYIYVGVANNQIKRVALSSF